MNAGPGTRSLSFVGLAIAGALGSLAAACASAPDTTADRAALRYDEALEKGRSGAPSRDVFFQDRVADVCDLPKNASFFMSGSADADDVDADVVHRVAECMRDGKLEKGNVVVIGYTDPSGSRAYNKLLGYERADAVAAALVAQGISRERIFVKSYGEAKAKDSLSEKDWAKDRKVTLRVAQPH